MGRKRKNGPVRAKAINYDGVAFKSGLERYMYIALKAGGMFEGYENEQFLLMDGETIPNRIYERQANSKGEFKLRSSQVRSISYTPDFCGKDYIIECKGRPNEAFPIRYKLFKKRLYELGDTRALFKPQNQKECDLVIDIIKSLRDEG